MAALTFNEIRARLALFSEKWKEATDEDAEAKSFWDELFTCYGTNRRQVARYEVPVTKLDGNKGFIDLLWKGKLIVEHKSRGKDLKAAKGQAEDYMERLKPSERPRYLVTCDFANFHVFDLHTGHEDKFLLSELSEKANILGFLGGYEPKRPSHEAPVNIEAVERLGQLYDSMKDGGYPDHDLQAFLVRVLFCLFAEDTGVFEPDAFTEIVKNRTNEDGADLGIKLAQVFETLDKEKGKRQKALDEAIAVLPYVNGRLFAGPLALAATDAKMRQALIACTDFDWSKISPAIFGSLFQGVMDAAERRASGAHYTSEENILKVIQPLFLDALRAEFAAIKNGPKFGREQKLEAFHAKLAKLKFFDPACGCGNFLIITYREIRRLEIEVLKELHPSGQQIIDVALLSTVNVDHFYGIEIDEFPSQIARVAMWLMDHVMNVELGYAFGQAITRLPLTKAANIVYGNALQLDWKGVITPAECSYIFGNPPFIGAKFMSDEQRKEIIAVSGNHKNAGLLDYVCAWYFKSADFIQGTDIKVAFVSTNSISQGEQPFILWERLQEKSIKIQFAHRTFTWENDARGKAHVHVVIVGISALPPTAPVIYFYDTPKAHPVKKKVSQISPYLLEGPMLALPNRQHPICPVSEIGIGNKPIDGGYFLFTPQEKDEFLLSEPAATPFFRRWIGADEFLNGYERWCLWLGDTPPEKWRHLKNVRERVELVAKYRRGEVPAKGKDDTPKNKTRDAGTQKLSTTPTRFHVENIPTSNYLVIPEVSSEKRVYMPIGYLGPETLASNLVKILPDASLYEFGVLCSTMHMDWMRTTAGRLESRYRYSIGIVFNNFPWPTPNPSQREAVNACAQAVLSARKKFPSSTLADLYDPAATPPELAKAHASLDRAVEKCYRPEPFKSDTERVEFLFALYGKITAPLAPSPISKKRKKTT